MNRIYINRMVKYDRISTLLQENAFWAWKQFPAWGLEDLDSLLFSTGGLDYYVVTDGDSGELYFMALDAATGYTDEFMPIGKWVMETVDWIKRESAEFHTFVPTEAGQRELGLPAFDEIDGAQVIAMYNDLGPTDADGHIRYFPKWVDEFFVEQED